jgi:predicted PurR-regulated permease PerM
MKKNIRFSSPLVLISIYTTIILIVSKIYIDAFVIIGIGILFVLMLRPLVEFLTKKFKIKSITASVLALIIFYSILTIILAFLIPSVISEFSGFINYWNNVLTTPNLDKYFKKGSYFYNFMNYLRKSVNPLMKNAPGYIGEFVTSRGPGIVEGIFFVILLSIYGILSPDLSKKVFLRLFPKSSKETIVKFHKDLFQELSVYISTQIFVAILVGIMLGIGLQIIGIKYYFILAVWGASVNIIQVIGAILAAIPIIIFAAANGIMPLILSLLLIIVVNTIGFLIFLKIIGNRIKINGFLIILSIIIMSYIYGTFGALIAVPFLIYIKLIFKYFITPLFNEL